MAVPYNPLAGDKPGEFDFAPDNQLEDSDMFDFYAPTPNPVSDSVATHRASKYDYAMGTGSPGIDNLRYAIQTGDEPTVRQGAIDLQRTKDQELKIGILRDYAQQVGAENVSQEYVDLIMMTDVADLANPDTFIEKQYARRFTGDVTMLDMDPEATDVDGTFVDDTVFGEALEENPEGTNRTVDAAHRIKANQELDLKLYEDTEARWKEAGWLSTISNYAEMVVPFLSWSRISGLIEEAKPSSILLGNNMKEQYLYLNTLPTDERHALIKARVAELEASNPLDALVFLRGLVSFNGTDQFLNNALSVTDLTLPVPGIGILPLRTGVAGIQAAGSATARLASTLKGALKASAGDVTSPSKVIAATGNIEKAGTIDVVERLNARGSVTSTPEAFSKLAKEVPNLLNAVGDTTDLGIFNSQREWATRVAEGLQQNSALLLQGAFDTVNTSGRLGADSIAQAAGSDEVKSLLNLQYGRGTDIVIDVTPIDPETTLGNVNFVEVKLGTPAPGSVPKLTKSGRPSKKKDTIQAVIGRKDATYFDSKVAAEQANKYWYKMPDATPIEVGGKWALIARMPVNETAITVRKALEIETANETPKSISTMFLQYFKSNDDRWSERLASEAKTSLAGGGELSALARQIAAPINKLNGVFSKRAYRELEQFMEHQRDLKMANGDRGTFSKSLKDFGQDWLDYHKKVPTTDQAEAYFASTLLNDIGWVGTNLGLYRDKTRKGFELFGFGRVGTPSIEGVRTRYERIFEHPDNVGIVLMDDADPDKMLYAMKHFMNDEDNFSQTTLKAKIDSGLYKVIEITDIGETQFRTQFAEQLSTRKMSSIDFIVTKDVTSRPLDFQQIPYKPGGHVDLADGWFVRQANVGQTKLGRATVNVYYGDKNLYHFLTEAQGKTVIGNLEKARQLYAAKDLKGLKAFINKSNLPHTYREFVKMFKGSKAKFDLNTPFYLTRKNETIEGTHKISRNFENFINKKDSPYNLYNGGINLEHAGERGDHMYTVINEGSIHAPVYNYAPARHISPVTVLDRATNAMLKGRYIDEFKHVAAERFIAEFGQVLGGDLSLMRQNPFKALIDATFNESTKANSELLAAAKASRRSVLEFLGVKDRFQKDIAYRKAMLWEKLVNRAGETKANKIVDLVDKLDGWAMGAIKDPVSFARSFAFHEKLGLFNPVQLFLQAQTMAHVMGVAGPVNGTKAVEAATIMRAAMLNEDHLDFLSKKAFGWNSGEFKEAYEWGKKSGWFRVGKEVAVRDDFLSDTIVQGRGARFLEAGTMFFREGERGVRMAAWNAAYLEWRAANPSKAMNNVALKKILNRADLLSVNMTAASNASWQKGFTGIPTQFFAYQTRLAEQFLGKRLTTKEKWSAFATYGAFYGIPVAVGAPFAVLPFHESIKGHLLDQGYDADGNIATQLLHDGMLSVVAEYATGTKYDTGERWGPGGLPFLKDLLDEDKTILEALGGVSGSSLIETIKATEPFAYKMIQMVSPNSELYNITQEDIWSFIRNINTGNQIYNLYTAVNIGRLITKNGVVVDEVNGVDGMMNFLLGVKPQRTNDTYKMMANDKAMKQYQEKGMKEAITELRRAFREDLSDQDQDEHFRRTHNIIEIYNLPNHMRRRVFSDAAKGYETLVHSIGWRYAKQSPSHLKYFEENIMTKEEE